KPGKDNNFRGLRIFHDTLYVSKGSGGNGINTVYQVGEAGAVRTLTPGIDLSTVPFTILPGFPTSLASGIDQQGNPPPSRFRSESGSPTRTPCMSPTKAMARS